MIQISIVQVLRKDGLNYEKILSTNKAFLDSVDTEKEKKLEYIVYDCLKNFEVTKIMKKFPELKYIRKEFLNLKNTFLEGASLSNGAKIIFLKSDDILTLENIQRIEVVRPNITRDKLEKLRSVSQDNFDYDKFNLLIKDKKTFAEKLKLLFSNLF